MFVYQAFCAQASIDKFTGIYTPRFCGLHKQEVVGPGGGALADQTIVTAKYNTQHNNLEGVFGTRKASKHLRHRVSRGDRKTPPPCQQCGSKTYCHTTRLCQLSMSCQSPPVKVYLTSPPFLDVRRRRRLKQRTEVMTDVSPSGRKSEFVTRGPPKIGKTTR